MISDSENISSDVSDSILNVRKNVGENEIFMAVKPSYPTNQ